MANTLRFKRGLVSGIPTAALGEPLFTTDTFDLYIGNGTGNTRFQKYIASGTTSQLLRGDGSLLSMPIVLTSPSNGQVLKYNGTNWVNSADAGVTGSGANGQVTFWDSASTITGSNNLFWNNTNGYLGIGTNTPSERLHVVTSAVSTAIFEHTGANGAIDVRNTGTLAANRTSQVRLSNGSTFFGANDRSWQIINLGTSATASVYTLQYFDGTNYTRPFTITDTGRLLLGSTTDNGLRFQVTGDGFFSGSVGIGSSSLTGHNLRISKTITGSTFSGGIYVDGTIQSSVTSSAWGYATYLSTQAATFNIANLSHFVAEVQTWGAGSTATNQYGFLVTNSLTQATNNYGFYGNIASGTGRWNLYMNGTAANYMAGNLGLGVTSPARQLHIYRAGVATEAYIQADAAQQAALYFKTLNNAIYVSAASSTEMRFFVNSADRLMIDGSGNLGLGATPGSWISSGRVAQIGNGSFYNNTSNLTAITHNVVYGASTNNYIASSQASAYWQINGRHEWYQAPSGTAGAVATFTQAMTLDASGNLGVGVTTVGDKLEVAGNVYANAFNSIGTLSRYNTTGGIAMVGLAGTGYAFISAYSNASGTGKNLSLQKDGGNVLIGTTTDAGFKLDVNGTIRVSGASTFGGRMTLDQSVNLPVYIEIKNTTSGNNAGAYLVATSTNGVIEVGKYSATNSTYKILSANTGFIRNSTAGDLSILNDWASGEIKMAAGGSFTPHFTIASTGAATFSSSVTATNLTLTDAGGGIINNNTGNLFFQKPTSGGFIFRNGSPSFTEYMRLDSTGNLGIGMTPSYKLDVTGEARVSNAISIGTTPDTNKPFKILKNINGTVGINFENTSTGSLAFSAIQMGTDVTGGTKFTNLVFASSGITASGVYNPDGTSLINNGSGGLNFLGNPIRMYTGGSNGTLRWDMTNDGFITQYTGTNPSTSATDGYRQYSADVVAGNAAPHFRTENGAVIKLYQETTGVGNAIFSQGGGNSVLDDSTFDGYTLRQIVRALRNQGILQ